MILKKNERSRGKHRDAGGQEDQQIRLLMVFLKKLVEN
jgi:hypothetical protein